MTASVFVGTTENEGQPSDITKSTTVFVPKPGKEGIRMIEHVHVECYQKGVEGREWLQGTEGVHEVRDWESHRGREGEGMEGGSAARVERGDSGRS